MEHIENGSRAGSDITRCLSGQASREQVGGGSMLFTYMGAAAAILVLVINIRPILAAFIAATGLGS